MSPIFDLGGHGPRLNKMAKMLQDSKGAVVACEDAIGIAQELSLHHMTAAIPYVAWLQTADAKGVSNQWRQAVSESLGTIELALAKNYVQAYDDTTENLRSSRDTLAGSYPGSDSNQPVKVRRPDGSYEEISVQELNQRRTADLNDRIGARESDRSVLGVRGSNSAATKKIDVYCDRGSVKAFDTEHVVRLKARDDLMDKIAADLQAWLKADDFIEKALGRYDENASVDSGDGMRCAGQLKAILEQIASAPKGRQWYAALDLFTPAKKNLVWTVLSLNNAAVSQELQGALAPLTKTATPGEAQVQAAQSNADNQKGWSDFAGALSKLTKTLSAADKIGKEGDALSGIRKPGTGGSADSYLQIGKAAYDGPLGVLFVALVLYLKNLPPTQREIACAKAQALTLAHGLGSEAVAYVRVQRALSAEMAAKSARDFDKALRKKLPKAAANNAAALRLNYVQFGLAGIALLPALANARNRADGPRSAIELSGSFAGLLGSLRQLQADRYEQFVFKQVPVITTKTEQEVLIKATGMRLLELKAAAARFVVAGAVVGVGLDGVDGYKARGESEKALSYAYYGRAATGIGVIATTIRSAQVINPVLWLSRANLALAIATIALTEIITALKGDAWANWLQAGPFHKAESKKIPYASETETMARLADALAEI